MSFRFLFDIQAIQLSSVYELLKQVFISRSVIKLGFRFKQDLVLLSYTFCQRGCEPGFDRVEPFIDITAIYNYLQPTVPGLRVPKQKSLLTICEEVLGILLSKELQCSDWSKRPLTEEQKIYAAADAHCLVEIFNVFQAKVVREANSGRNYNKHRPSDLDPGLKIFETSDYGSLVRSTTKYVKASNVVRTTVPELCGSIETTEDVDSSNSYKINKEVDNTLLWIVRKYRDRILLKDSDKKPKTSKKKTKSLLQDWSASKRPWK